MRVPQVSRLGPILFILYVKDATDYINVKTATQYANDTTFSVRSKVMRAVCHDAEVVVQGIESWFTGNAFVIRTLPSRFYR